MNFLRFFLFIISFPLLSGSSGGAEPRIALVIGNSDYAVSDWKLSNPAHDATLMADALRSVGFDVTLLIDATEDQMDDAFYDHGVRLAAGGTETIGVFYFAGHATEADGRNFLFPVDIRASSQQDVWRQAPRLGDVIDAVSYTDTATNIIIIDACRNNPLPSSRSLGGGLAPAKQTSGLLVAYAAQAGQVADDGTGEHSPYTSVLAELITSDRLTVESVFRYTATRVERMTRGIQIPSYVSGLTGRDFCFKTCPTDFIGNLASMSETALLNHVMGSEAPDELKAFLALYPDSDNAQIVIDRLIEIGTAEALSSQSLHERLGLCDRRITRRSDGSISSLEVDCTGLQDSLPAECPPEKILVSGKPMIVRNCTDSEIIETGDAEADTLSEEY